MSALRTTRAALLLVAVALALAGLLWAVVDRSERLVPDRARFVWSDRHPVAVAPHAPDGSSRT